MVLAGYFGEGRRWLEEALAKSSRAPTAARARALQRVSWLALLQGDLDRAEEASEEGLRLEGVELFRTGGGDSTAAENPGRARAGDRIARRKPHAQPVSWLP
jgi:hypothetical protein